MTGDGLSTLGAWREAWGLPRFRWLLVGGALLAVVLAFALPGFFEVIELRAATVPPEPLLVLFEAMDVAVPTFLVLYAGVVFGTWALLRRPMDLVRMVHAYAALLGLRMLTMYLFTFDPPMGIIPLEDPVTAVFYPGGEPFLKDLFFSGHTATLVLFAFAMGPGHQRTALLLAALVVGGLVLVQHVHYTVDVLAAPFFAGLAWWVAGIVLRAAGLKVSDVEAA
jgi:hypothetical protein